MHLIIQRALWVSGSENYTALRQYVILLWAFLLEKTLGAIGKMLMWLTCSSVGLWFV